MDSCIILPPELIRIVVSYSDASTLASLDLTCKEMSKHTNVVWVRLAKERFGEAAAEDGKKSWRSGISLVSDNRREPPIELWQPDRGQDYILPECAENGRILVIAARTAAYGCLPLQIRDCQTAEVLEERMVTGVDFADNICDMVICGSAGNEIIVLTTNFNHVIVYHGMIGPTVLHRGDGFASFDSRTKLLGKVDLLLVLRYGKIYFYRPADPPGSDLQVQLLQLLHTAPFYTEAPVMYCSATAWSSPHKTEFGLSYEDCRVCIWSLGEDNSGVDIQPQLVETFLCRPPERDQLDLGAQGHAFLATMFSSLAFNGAYVVAIRSRFLMIIFDRKSGTVVHRVSASQLHAPSDLGELRSGNADIFIRGSYLLSALQCKRKCSFTVWDLKSGTASHHPIPFISTVSYTRRGYCASVVHLSHLRYFAFYVPFGDMLLLWGFPKSREDREHFEMIRSREARCLACEDYDTDADDSGYEEEVEAYNKEEEDYYEDDYDEDYLDDYGDDDIDFEEYDDYDECDFDKDYEKNNAKNAVAGGDDDDDNDERRGLGLDVGGLGGGNK